MDQLARNIAGSLLSPWLLGSVVAYALVTSFWWLVRGRDRWPGLHAAGLEEVVHFAFSLGVPYLVLGGWPRPPGHGLLSLNEIGLVGLQPRWPAARWLGAWGLGLGLAVGAAVILLLGRGYARRAAGGRGIAFPRRAWWALLLDGLCLQVHWAFYRAAIVAISGDIYAGVFLGLGLVYLEWGLNPFWSEGWRTPGLMAVNWLRAALALTSAYVFLLTRNLWVCLGVYWLVEVVFWRLGREPGTLHGASRASEDGENVPPGPQAVKAS